ncbi:MAG: hypothetical protein ACT4O0_05370 [Pseudonocardia sp.]
MNRPYSAGQNLAWLDPHPDGIRLHRATVIHIQPAAEQTDRWNISTDRGDATVDHTGHSGHILPIDTDIATELYIRGDGYLIHPTLIEHRQTIERDIHELDHSADNGDDLGLE